MRAGFGGQLIQASILSVSRCRGEEEEELVQLGGYCRRSALSLINLAYLLAGDCLL